MMRFLVCSGMERAAAELFSAADTVPGVSPRCCAMVLSVTLASPRCAGFSLGGSMIFIWFSAHLLKMRYSKRGAELGIASRQARPMPQQAEILAPLGCCRARLGCKLLAGSFAQVSA